MKLRPMSRIELAELYGISTKTLARKIKAAKISIESYSLLMPVDLLRIFDSLGWPQSLE